MNSYIGPALFVTGVIVGIYNIVQSEKSNWMTQVVSTLALVGANRILTPVTSAVFYGTGNALGILQIITLLNQNRTEKDQKKIDQNKLVIVIQAFMLTFFTGRYFINKRYSSEV